MWQRLFVDEVLKDGLRYFTEGRVKLKEATSSYINGLVFDEIEYEVEIKMYNNDVEQLICSCSNESRCGHMAAVLFEAHKSKSSISTNEHNSYVKSVSHRYKSLEDYTNKERALLKLKALDENSLRAFIANVVIDNSYLAHEFLDFIKLDDGGFNLNTEMKKLNNTVAKFRDDAGVINYYRVKELEAEINKYFDINIYALLYRGLYESAFKSAIFIAQLITRLNIDDSKEVLLRVLDRCMGVITSVIKNCNDSLEAKIIDYLISELTDEANGHYNQLLDKVLFNNFLYKDALLKKRSYVEDKISKLIVTDGIEDNEIGSFVKKKLEIMDALGVSDDEITDYINNNWLYADTRLFVINKCHANDDDRAVEVLIESKELDKDNKELILIYNKMLKDIYKSQYSMSKYQDILWEELAGEHPNKEVIYDELKATFSDEEWFEKREMVFKLDSCNDMLHIFYHKERLLDRLLDCILNYKGLKLLNQYEDELKVIYEGAILGKYIDEVNKLVIVANDHNMYKNLLSILAKIKAYPNGGDIVNNIVNEWGRKYNIDVDLSLLLSKL